jgi:serine/threonine-protein kinase Chk2
MTLTPLNQGGGDEPDSTKKPRRSQRLSASQAHTTPVSKKQQLPSPITQQESSVSSTEQYKEGTVTPPEGRPSQLHHRPYDHNAHPEDLGFSSPPQDTQAFSQFVYPTAALSTEVTDEAEEGVWGYLLPLDQKYGKSLVLRKRNACPMPDGMENFGKSKGDRQSKNNGKDFEAEEEAYEETKLKGIASGGYLIGRHPECGKLMLRPLQRLS